MMFDDQPFFLITTTIIIKMAMVMIMLRRDENIPMISKFPEQLVLPFLWAQDGFGEPSDEMAEVDNARNGHNQFY